MVKFILNKKSLMKFGKWSLALFSLVLLGFFVVQYIIPILAMAPPATMSDDVIVTLIHPTDGAYTDGANFTFNANWQSQFNLTNCTLVGNFTGGAAEAGNFLANTTNISTIVNNTYYGINATNVTDGYYLWNVYCFNETSHGNYFGSNYSVTVDLTDPVINYVFPGNNGYFNDTNAVNFNVTLAEQNIDFDINVTVYWRRQEADNSTSYIGNTTVCSGTAPNYGCNITVDVHNYISEDQIMEFIFNTTDSANRTSTNGTEADPLTATFDSTDPGSVSDLVPEGNSSTSYFNSTTLVFNWSVASDSKSGIQYYNIYVDDNEGGYSFNGSNTTPTGYQFTGSEGNTYTINVTAVDNAFNENTTGTVSITMTVDTTPPGFVGGLEPTGNYTTLYYNTTTLIFNWSADASDSTSGIKQYKIYVNENLTGYNYDGTNTTPLGYQFTGIEGRNYSVNVTAVDIAENHNITGNATATMAVDTTPPGFVGSLRPTTNSSTSYFNSTTLVFNWSDASDTTSGIQQYKIYVNDNSAGYNYNGTNTTPTGYQFTGSEDHTYTVNVTAVDNSDNENTTGNASITMTVDTTPPGFVGGLEPNGNYTPTYYNTTTLIFNWSADASDSTSGIKQYKIYVNENLTGYNYDGTNTTPLGYQFTGIEGRNYSVNVTAVDIAENHNITGNASEIMVVDTTPPGFVGSLRPTGNYTTQYYNSTTLVFNWSDASDSTSGIKQYKIYVNEDLAGYTYDGTNTTPLGYQFTGIEGRNYSVNVTAVDNSDNENTTGNATATMIVDTTAPVINTTTPTDGGYFSDPNKVFFQVSLYEQNLDTSVNVSVYWRSQTAANTSSYESVVLNCTGSAPSYTCNGTKDVHNFISNEDVMEFIFNTTDSAEWTGTNGTEADPLTATADTMAPNYTNEGDNATTFKSGEPVHIYAQWTDNLDLSYAWLWTNETGSTGMNYTVNYSSPDPLSGTSDWANFTWQNASVPTGTVVGWRIYANDSAGHENVTGIGTFTTDDTPPIFVNNGTNFTVGSTLAKDTPIFIYAQWSDNIELGYYWISNSTDGATWLNYTTTAMPASNWTNISIETAGLGAGTSVYYRIWANDTSSNQNVTNIMVWSIDNTPPFSANNATNTSDTIVKGTLVVIYANWTDNVGLSHYWLWNDSSGSEVNDTATAMPTSNWTNISIDTTNFPVGSFTAKIYVNDTSGNQNVTAVETWTIDDEGPDYGNESNSEAGEAEYVPGVSYTLNISWTDDLGDGNVSKAILEWNELTNYTSVTDPAVLSLGSGNFSLTVSDLAAENYTYRWFANDTSDNWNSTGALTLNITQNTTNPITMYLTNDTTYTNDNIAISAGNTVTVNGTFTHSNSGTMALYSNVTTENESLVDVGSPKTTSASLSAGVYVFIANTSGNVNYTSNSTGPGTFYLTVTADTTAPTITLPVYVNDTIRKSGAEFILNISVSDSTGVNPGDSCNVTFVGTEVWNRTLTYSGGWCNGTIIAPVSGVGADGNFTINITVNDNSTETNEGYNDSYVLVIDNTTPVITGLTAPNNTYNKSAGDGRMWINGTVYDNIKMGPGNVTISGNNASSFEVYNFTGVNNSAFAVYNNTTVSDGLVELTFTYTDNATNSISEAVQFYLDNTPPDSATALKNSSSGKYQESSAQVVQILLTDTWKTNDTIILNYTKYNIATGDQYTWTAVSLSGTHGTSTTYTGTIDTINPYQEDGWVIQYFISGGDNATNSIASGVGGSDSSPLANITIDNYCGNNGTALSYCSHENWPELTTGAANNYYEVHLKTASTWGNALSDYNISTVLNSIDGSYSYVYYYNESSSSWLSYDPNQAWNEQTLRFGNNSFTEYWINATSQNAVIRI